MLTIISNIFTIALLTYIAIEETKYEDRLSHIMLCVVFGILTFFIILIKAHEIINN